VSPFNTLLVMRGLVPGIHVLETKKPWMAGTSPAMTRIWTRGTLFPSPHWGDHCLAMSEAGPVVLAPSTLRSRAKR
jgi:hypothetical protein